MSDTLPEFARGIINVIPDTPEPSKNEKKKKSAESSSSQKHHHQKKEKKKDKKKHHTGESSRDTAVSSKQPALRESKSRDTTVRSPLVWPGDDVAVRGLQHNALRQEAADVDAAHGPLFDREYMIIRHRERDARLKACQGQIRGASSNVPEPSDSDASATLAGCFELGEPAKGSSFKSKVDRAALRPWEQPANGSTDPCHYKGKRRPVFSLHAPAARLAPLWTDPPPPPADPSACHSQAGRLLIRLTEPIHSPALLRRTECVWGRFALFCLASRRRVSEWWRVPLSDRQLVQEHFPAGAENHAQPDDPLAAGFPIASPSPSLRLVLFLEKVVRDDEGAGLDAKPPKNEVKYADECRERALTLGSFFQPYALAHCAPFHDSRGLPAELRFAGFCRTAPEAVSDQGVLAVLAEGHGGAGGGGESVPHLASLPGYELHCAVRLLDLASWAAMPGRLDAEGFALRSQHPPASDAGAAPSAAASPVKELCHGLGSHALAGSGVGCVQPVHHLHVCVQALNFSNYPGGLMAAQYRNLSVAVSVKANDHSLLEPGLPVFAGGASRIVSPLTYHNKRPVFYFEATAIRLPAELTRSHHLLFEICHITCKLPKKKVKPESMVTTAGFACLPLTAASMSSRSALSLAAALSDRTRAIPVATDLPKENYLDAYFGGSEKLKWVDKRNPCLSVSTRLCSTVVSQNSVIHSFLHCPVRVIEATGAPAAADDGPDATTLNFEALIQQSRALTVLVDTTLSGAAAVAAAAEPDSDERYTLDQLTVWAFPILDRLLAVMLAAETASNQRHPSLSSLKRATFDALVAVAYAVSPGDRKGGKSSSSTSSGGSPAAMCPIASQFAHYVFDAGGSSSSDQRAVAVALINQWHAAAAASTAAAAVPGAVAAALAAGAASSPRLTESSDTSDPQRGQQTALASRRRIMSTFLATLITKALTRLVRKKLKDGRAPADPDLFQALDRLVRQLASDTADAAAGSSSFAEAHHVARGVARFLCDLYGLFDGVDMVNPLVGAFAGALDPRYQSPAATSVKLEFLRLFSLYEHYMILAQASVHADSATMNPLSNCRDRWRSTFFLPSLLLDTIVPLLTKASSAGSPLPTAGGGSAVRSGGATLRHTLAALLELQPGVKPRHVANLFFVLVPTCVSRGANWLLGGGTADETADWLVCFVFVVKRASPALLVEYWQQETKRRRATFFKLCNRAVTVCRERARQSAHQTATTLRASAKVRRDGAGANKAASGTANVAALLVQELALVVHGTVLLYMDSIGSDRMAHETSVTKEMWSAFMEASLGIDLAAPKFVLACFQVIRRFCWSMRATVFGSSVTQISQDLCYQVLRYCNAGDDQVRSMAATVFYLLIILNHKQTKDFNRVKLHSIIACNKLAGQWGSEVPTLALKSSLEAVTGLVNDGSANSAKLAFALSTKTSVANTKELQRQQEQDVSFADQIEDLTSRLFSVLKNVAIIARSGFDHELQFDLYFQMSVKNAQSPVLRVTWLENLAKLLEQRDCPAEAGCTMLLLSWILVEFLSSRSYGSKKNRVKGLIGGRSFFKDICQLPFDPKLPTIDEPGLFDSPIFSKAGLLNCISSAVRYFKQAHLYELAVPLLNLVNNIYYVERDFSILGQNFRQQSSLCDLIVESNSTESRLFALYYRVHFVGPSWEEFEDKEYIYKCRPDLMVAEFSETLVRRFSRKFQQVRLLKSSADEAEQQTPAGRKIAWLRINAVNVLQEPSGEDDGLDDSGGKGRRGGDGDGASGATHFERNHNVDRFILEVPFTKGSSQYGDTASQFKRKFIYKTQRSFPSVTPRQQVIRKQEIVLTPVQVSLEIIEGRVRDLKDQLTATPPNPKALSRILQGSVLLQVNAGPLEICRVFLNKDMSSSERGGLEPHRTNLIHAMCEFVHSARDGLRLHQNLIDADQAEFHAQLEEGFGSTRSQIAQYMPSDIRLVDLTDYDDDDDDEEDDLK